MSYDPDVHHRRSIRLPGFDYSGGGTFFVTICVDGRECLFGDVIDGEMHPNGAGRMIDANWRKLPSLHPAVALDAFQLMPNHLHAVVLLTACPDMSLWDLMRRFKSFTANRYVEGVRSEGWTRPREHLWQGDYYEHVVRDDRSLESIREYIAANPANWTSDPDNPTVWRRR
jgi:REP element-mobilizing transposase RayT